MVNNFVNNQNYVYRSKYAFILIKDDFPWVFYCWMVSFVFQVVFSKIIIENIIGIPMDDGIGFILFIIFSGITFFALVIREAKKRTCFIKHPYFSGSFEWFRNYILLHKK